LDADLWPARHHYNMFVIVTSLTCDCESLLSMLTCLSCLCPVTAESSLLH